MYLNYITRFDQDGDVQNKSKKIFLSVIVSLILNESVFRYKTDELSLTFECVVCCNILCLNYILLR